jgi:hypothetical protein
LAKVCDYGGSEPKHNIYKLPPPGGLISREFRNISKNKEMKTNTFHFDCHKDPNIGAIKRLLLLDKLSLALVAALLDLLAVEVPYWRAGALVEALVARASSEKSDRRQREAFGRVAFDENRMLGLFGESLGEQRCRE